MVVMPAPPVPKPADPDLAAAPAVRSEVNYPLVAGMLIAASAVFHFWYAAGGALNLAPDEAHYWEWSRRLDWSYYSKGPMVAYLIALSTRVGGHSELCVRLPAVVLGASTCALAYALTRRLFSSEHVALLAVVAYLACPLFAAGSLFMTTDVPLVFFWVLAIYALVRAVDATGAYAWRWWLVCGAAVGLGLISKYTMAFFFVALAASLALSHRWRAQLRSPAFAVAMLLSVVIFAPVVLWNAAHGWISLHHVAGLAGLAPALAPSTRHPLALLGEFVGGQLGVVSPLLFCGALVALGRSATLGVRRGDDAHLLLACFALPILGFFLVLAVLDKSQPNWPAPAYATAFIAAAVWWDERVRRATNPSQRRRRRAGLALALSLGFAISAVAHFSGWLPRVGIHLPPRLDPTDRLRGWDELGQRVGALLAAAPDHFLMASSYHIASELAFYTPGHPRAYEVNLGRRQSQYDIWGGLDDRRGESALFVTFGEWPAEAFAVICALPRMLDVVRIVRDGQTIETFSIYDCGGFKGTPQFGVPATY